MLSRFSVGVAVVVLGVGVVGLAQQATPTASPAQTAQSARQPWLRFFVSVTDTTGAPVKNVQPDDLTVYEGGIPGKVITLDPIEWPVKIAVLVDNGIGMSKVPLGQLRESLRTLIRALPAGVEISIQTLAPQPRFVARATTDKGLLLQRIDLITIEDGSFSRFVDALSETSARFVEEIEKPGSTGTFPVAIMVGTNSGDPSTLIEKSVNDMMGRFLRANATVHAVMLTAVTLDGNGALQIDITRRLTGMTGGRYDAIAAGSGLTGRLQSVGEQVAKSHARQRHQYLVTFERPASKTDRLEDISFSAPSGKGWRGKLSLDGRLP